MNARPHTTFGFARLRREWRRHAACRGHDEDDWFGGPDRPNETAGPGAHKRDANEAVLRAKAVCADCPVKQECLDEAIAHGEEGVWGGLTKDERKASTRNPRAA